MPALIKGVITCVFLFLLQIAADFIPGADLVGVWVKFVLAVIILVVLVCLIKPLAGTVHHVTDKITSDDLDFKKQLSKIIVYTVMIVYLGFVYQSVLTPVLLSSTGMFHVNPMTIRQIKWICALVGVVLIVMLAVTAYPFIDKLTSLITGKITKNVEK